MIAKKILIVDDEEPLRKILKERLEKENFVIYDAKDGEEGLKTAIEKKPDLILLDVLMPKMNGFEMTKKLREHEQSTGILANNQIPIIFLTNVGEEKGMPKSQQEGIYDYLVKANWDLEGIVKKVKDKLEIA